MKYCTIADIQQKRIPEQTLVQLTDDQGMGLVDEAVVGSAIDEAGELIDGYLRARYSLPLSPVPPLLGRLAAAIAAYQIYGRRPEFPTPDRVKDDHKHALDTLRLIQRGEVRLLPEADAAASQEQDSPLQASGPKRIFDTDTLDRF